MDQNAHIIPIDEFQATCLEFWHIYYESMRELHARRGWVLTEPLRDRNLGTTASRHVAVFENFWRQQLATAIGVERHEVGSRTIQFREHRSKSFDVCWPLTGEPKILISCKSMQNAYRNVTNRIEEALGDSAVLRLYRSTAVFGFFFFILDGNVPRGIAEQARLQREANARMNRQLSELSNRPRKMSSRDDPARSGTSWRSRRSAHARSHQDSGCRQP